MIYINCLNLAIANLSAYNSKIRRNIRMEVRAIGRSSTFNATHKKSTLKLNQAKTKKVEEESQKQNVMDVSVYAAHPAGKYLLGTSPDKNDFKKFATLLYRGLSYSINNLKGPSQEFIKKKKVKLPDPEQQRRKFLMLDLDETLIHSVFTNEKTDVKFIYKSEEFKFNIRPYCFQFLEAMSKIYALYVFTAGTQDYAEPIVQYLNKRKKTISGVLHRKNCMETHNGFYIKDLRIIENRELKDILIVDNLVHSFGLQLTNGVPILEFTNNKKDKELQNLQTFLREFSQVQDVRPLLKQRLKLHKCLQIDENTFISIDEDMKTNI